MISQVSFIGFHRLDWKFYLVFGKYQVPFSHPHLLTFDLNLHPDFIIIFFRVFLLALPYPSADYRI
jgi:hypothetical protein